MAGGGSSPQTSSIGARMVFEDSVALQSVIVNRRGLSNF